VKQKYEGIEQMSVEFGVRGMCAFLGVSASGYYAWLKRVPSEHAREDEGLQQAIESIWIQNRGIYGAPRVHAELRDQGHRVSRKRVARLMRQAGLQGRMARRKRPRTTISDPANPAAPNLVNRQFKDRKPNEVWLADITYIDTEQGWLYLAGVLDLGTRQLVGLAMADHMRTDLVEQALTMAYLRHRPNDGLIHHSDLGSQYTSHDYQTLLKKYHMLPSMSRVGNCLDNAPIESFWATLKRECADHVFASHDCARAAIFGYVMTFYNRRRRHSVLAFQTLLSHAA
jgi:transposase InsO family protein